VDGQALYTGLFRLYAAIYKEIWGSLQSSSKESGQQDASQAEQNKCRKRDRNSEDECCTKKLKRPPPTYQNPRPVATNNFFAPLGDLPMENAEPSSEGNYIKTPEKNDSMGKSRPPSIVLTSEANLNSLKKERKIVVRGEFFQNTATGTLIMTKSTGDYSAI
jgi:hypothetical protein